MSNRPAPHLTFQAIFPEVSPLECINCGRRSEQHYRVEGDDTDDRAYLLCRKPWAAPEEERAR
jgi:hypothetical protein